MIVIQLFFYCISIAFQYITNFKQMKTILITGSNGQLGSEIRKLSVKITNLKFIFTDVEELDITNIESVINFFTLNKINFIVNCAAYTAVDKAETDLENAKKINILGVKNLSIISEENNIPIIHISTDYVFDGKNYRPYQEDAQTSPQSVYGETKLEGEKIIQKLKNHIIIRTSWLYSTFGNNFVKTILRIGKQHKEIKVVFDQIGTPTNAADLADAIFQILQQSASNINNFHSGVYHYSNEGVCSWYDFAIQILQQANIKCKVNPVETNEFPTPAARPNYSVLNKNKIKKTFSIEIPYWADSLIVKNFD